MTPQPAEFVIMHIDVSALHDWVLIGPCLQGALLLVLFQASHTIEHELTEQAQGNLESLVRQVPETATLVELSLSGQPDIQAARKAPVDTVAIGSNTLVMAGEQVRLLLQASDYDSCQLYRLCRCGQNYLLCINYAALCRILCTKDFSHHTMNGDHACQSILISFQRASCPPFA